MIDETKEREAFEKWYAAEYMMPPGAFRSVEGTYEKGFVKDAWEAWLARSQAPAPALPVEAIEYALATMDLELDYLCGQYSQRPEESSERHTWKRRIAVCKEHIAALRALFPKPEDKA